jgi:uncharacterized RDD family membrane protein YckC
MEQTEILSPVLQTSPQSSQGPIIRPGGFWIRGIAVLIDGLILAIPSLIIRAVIYAVVAAVSQAGAFLLFAWCTSTLLGILISLAYHTYFYQSSGSTPGKKIFQLKVVDNTTGNLLSFKQVFMREVVGKFLSAITFMIGYIMAGVRTDKRALHDLIANTKVQEISGL